MGPGMAEIDLARVLGQRAGFPAVGRRVGEQQVDDRRQVGLGTVPNVHRRHMSSVRSYRPLVSGRRRRSRRSLAVPEPSTAVEPYMNEIGRAHVLTPVTNAQ